MKKAKKRVAPIAAVRRLLLRVAATHTPYVKNLRKVSSRAEWQGANHKGESFRIKR